MRLTSFRVRRYKNVIDSTEVAVESDVTTLVGMNESGKSTMLDALYKLNPVYGDAFVERDDYPRWRWKRDGRKEDLSRVTPISAWFRLDAEDREALGEALGEGVVTSETVKISRRYDKGLSISVDIDEERFLRNALEGHPIAEEMLAAHDTIASLKAALAPVLAPAQPGDEEEEQEKEPA